jgi:hypothetical protein
MQLDELFTYYPQLDPMVRTIDNVDLIAINIDAPRRVQLVRRATCSIATGRLA